jgi:PST family polysaccharide transporter
VDPLILGLFASASTVGVYFFAQSMVSQIFRVVTLNLSGVLLPALNKIVDDPPRQTAAFMRAASVLMLIGAPLCVGLGSTGSMFVRVFLSAAKWHDLPPVLAALAFGVVFRLLDEPMQSLISAQGRFRLSFFLSIGTGSSYVLACLIGSLTGRALYTAIAVGLYYVIAGPTILCIAIRASRRELGKVIGVFVFPLLLSILAIVPWLLLDRWIPGQGRWRDGGVLAVIIVGAGLSYSLLGRLFNPPGWQELIDRLHAFSPARLKRWVRIFGGNQRSASSIFANQANR